MSREEKINEDAADVLADRLRRRIEAKGYTVTEVAGVCKVSRHTVYRLLTHKDATLTTVTKICKAFGWDLKMATTRPEERKVPVNLLFHPESLSAAARFCRPDLDRFRLQLLLSAASYLQVNLLASGVVSRVASPDTISGNEVRVIIMHGNDIPKAAVAFSVKGGRITYAAFDMGPAGAKLQFTGTASETGFSFCQEFLLKKGKPEKLDRKGGLSQRVSQHLETYGQRPNRSK